MSPQRHAFTLIEMLVVVAVIAILAGMLITIIPQVKFTARKMVTGQRMQVVTQGLSQRGQDEGSGAYAIQVALNLDGVRTFDTSGANPLPTPALGSWLSPTAPAAAPPAPDPSGDDYKFNYPWGKKWVDSAGAQHDPQPHLLRNLRTDKTIDFLHLANVVNNEFNDANNNGTYDAGEEKYADLNGNGVPDNYQTLYKTDRAEKEGWNDKWGHPLVVGYAIYQPGNGQAQSDALRNYQYARSIYIAVASAGPFVRNCSDDDLKQLNDSYWLPPVSTWTNNSFTAGRSGGNISEIWKQANQVCQQDLSTPDDRAWNEASFDNPPWQDIKWGKRKFSGHTENCFLTAPLEIK